MEDFVTALENEFLLHANSSIAKQQEAYMRNLFVFYGIKSPKRKKIQKPFLDKNHLPLKKEAANLVKQLWAKPQREFQYTAQELLQKYKNVEPNDIVLLEYMLTNKSWWDTVDFIAANLVGAYFISFPKQRKKYVKKWIDSNSIWLQRTAVLFQLKYKNKVDTVLLSQIINALLGSNDFFITKAIGWMLRNYSKSNPAWVKQFVSQTNLSPLSKKEALKYLS